MSETNNKFSTLYKYFPSGVAGGEREILGRVFVRDEDFADLLTPPPGNIRLLVGTKGSGKSAFLEASHLLLSEANVPVISLAPLDFANDPMGGISIAEVSSEFLAALVRAVASKLGSQLKPLVTGDDEILHRIGLQEGEKQPDFVSRFARLVSEIEFSGVKLKPGALLEAGSSALSKQLMAIEGNIRETHGAFFVLFDDLDQVSRLEGGLDVERIYACLIALKKLASEVPSLRVVVTLRDEVWRALRRARSEKVDQLDHFVMSVRTISPGVEQIKEIVRKRLKAAADELGLHGKFNEYDPFFKGAMGRMPSSNKRSSWDDLIATRSRERPRDAVQLIGTLALRKINKPQEFIDDDDLAEVMPEFSRERVELIAQEYKTVCPRLSEIIEALRDLPFRAGSYTAYTEDVREFLERLSGKFAIIINGKTINTSSIDGVLEVWRLLFDVGVLNARASDTREDDKYRHIAPREKPNLVTLAHWNDMQAVLWEVNPAYRDRLQFLQQEDKARDGLAIKQKGSDKRRRR